MLKDEYEVVQVQAVLRDKTKKAMLLEFQGGKKIHWIPNTLIEWIGNGTFRMAKFKAKELGLI